MINYTFTKNSPDPQLRSLEDIFTPPFFYGCKMKRILTTFDTSYQDIYIMLDTLKHVERAQPYSLPTVTKESKSESKRESAELVYKYFVLLREHFRKDYLVVLWFSRKEYILVLYKFYHFYNRFKCLKTEKRVHRSKSPDY